MSVLFTDIGMAVQVGTPICALSKTGEKVDLGKIASLELNHKPVDRAKRGESVAMKIEATNTTEATRFYGRHFDHTARSLPHPHCPFAKR